LIHTYYLLLYFKALKTTPMPTTIETTTAALTNPPPNAGNVTGKPAATFPTPSRKNKVE